MHPAGRAAAAWAVALATAALAGCSSSATYPYERDFVWTLAVAEATVWRPTLIDEEQHRIVSEKTNLAGAELTCKLQLQPDLNPFARRPSTRAETLRRGRAQIPLQAPRLPGRDGGQAATVSCDIFLSHRA